MRSTQTQKNKKNILIITVISAIVLITAGYVVFAYTQHTWPFTTDNSNSTDTKTQQEVDDLNANDPTYPTEKNKDTSQTKNEDENPKTDSGANKSTVQVGISSAGKFNNNVEVRAFISGVIEGNGTCTADFTKDNQTISGTSSAFIDTHTTQCQPITLDSNKFSPGAWTVTVTYESSSHQGKSSSMEITL